MTWIQTSDDNNIDFSRDNSSSRDSHGVGQRVGFSGEGRVIAIEWEEFGGIELLIYLPVLVRDSARNGTNFRKIRSNKEASILKTAPS